MAALKAGGWERGGGGGVERGLQTGAEQSAGPGGHRRRAVCLSESSSVSSITDWRTVFLNKRSTHEAHISTNRLVLKPGEERGSKGQAVPPSV